MKKITVILSSLIMLLSACRKDSVLPNPTQPPNDLLISNISGTYVSIESNKGKIVLPLSYDTIIIIGSGYKNNTNGTVYFVNKTQGSLKRLADPFYNNLSNNFNDVISEELKPNSLDNEYYIKDVKLITDTYISKQTSAIENIYTSYDINCNFSKDGNYIIMDVEYVGVSTTYSVKQKYRKL